MKPTLLPELFDYLVIFFSFKQRSPAVHSRKLIGRKILGESDACCEPPPDSAAGKGKRIHPSSEPDQNPAFQGGEGGRGNEEKVCQFI